MGFFSQIAHAVGLKHSSLGHKSPANANPVAGHNRGRDVRPYPAQPYFQQHVSMRQSGFSQQVSVDLFSRPVRTVPPQNYFNQPQAIYAQQQSYVNLPPNTTYSTPGFSVSHYSSQPYATSQNHGYAQNNLASWPAFSQLQNAQWTVLSPGQSYHSEALTVTNRSSYNPQQRVAAEFQQHKAELMGGHPRTQDSPPPYSPRSSQPTPTKPSSSVKPPVSPPTPLPFERPAVPPRPRVRVQPSVPNTQNDNASITQKQLSSAKAKLDIPPEQELSRETVKTASDAALEKLSSDMKLLEEENGSLIQDLAPTPKADEILASKRIPSEDISQMDDAKKLKIAGLMLKARENQIRESQQLLTSALNSPGRVEPSKQDINNALALFEIPKDKPLTKAVLDDAYAEVLDDLSHFTEEVRTGDEEDLEGILEQTGLATEAELSPMSQSDMRDMANRHLDKRLDAMDAAYQLLKKLVR
ncbi:hypothetical protein [Parendozoicomonas sp. Alg238-R29]|uniref:hypothetical protein n=1 Tax=Parendozoicomonas sp. Alg238-R29 TaxID=2993446 RepID=UPI00248DA4FA|nr:hypothetical protein [Parendozoicomonas sp. Alg238-R29]